MWLQLGAGQSIFPEPTQFPQPEASGGLQDCEKISTGNESQEQLGPFGRQGPAARSLRRLNSLGPPRPLPQWVITTRCPAADVTLQGREGRETLGSTGNSWTRINIPEGKGRGVCFGLFSMPGTGVGARETLGTSALLWSTTFFKSQFPSEMPWEWGWRGLGLWVGATLNNA